MPLSLQNYFTGIFRAEQSGEEFLVALEHVWRIGYSSKEASVKVLKKNFVQNVDYQVSVQLDENPLGGRPVNQYFLSVSCLEYFVVRVNREVFEVYRQCRKAVRALLNPPAPVPVLPTTFKQALQALLGVMEHNEVLELALTEVRLKIQFFNTLTAYFNAVPISMATKILKLPGMGRTKLLRHEHARCH